MIILLILTILLIIFQVLLTLNIKIEIENLKMSLPRVNNKIINKESKISMKFYVLKRIKIGEINLKKIKMDNIKVKNRIDKIKKKMLETNDRLKININAIETLRYSNYRIEKLDLKIYEGIEDTAITAILVGVTSTVISILFRNKITNTDVQRYEVIPIYQNINILKLELDSIFDFNIANIIDIVKVLRKGSVDKNDRTSYRRPYAYSNE